MTALPAGAFAGLSNLEELFLSYNQLATLPADTLAGLSQLTTLWLHNNRLPALPALPAGTFSGLAALGELTLSDNQLADLPDGIFAGLGSLHLLVLHNNPGAPFPLTLQLERTDAARAAAGPATVSVNVGLGAPFEMSIGVAATGGTVSPAAATVPPGDVRSDSFTVTASGAAPVTVSLDALPATPPDVEGFEVLAGRPLRLFDPAGDDGDYDADDDGLIEVSTLAQLDAVRYDVDGDGAADDPADWPAYTAAYAGGAADMGCPRGCGGYELVASLDFDTDGSGRVDAGDLYWNGGAGWLPIGDVERKFAATFDGNGHTVANLFVDRPARAGLFGTTSRFSVIRHLGWFMST